MLRSERRIRKINRVLRHRQPDLTVVMENIHDPHNVSAVFRSCDAVGVMRVELLYTLEKFPRIGKKSSSSANKWLERRKHTSVDECYSTLRSEGFRIYATHLATDGVSLYDLDLTQKIALVFGNEHRGLSEEAAAKADCNFVIPMVGMIQSLNISVACAVSLYEALRQRILAGALASPKIPKNDLEELAAEWLKR
ncbi:MAG: RNA methyltransferase [Bacteroidetes bacterium]|nr:RNA methyltransferase [Bacteroidota bacterium]MCW5897562.1 RNA methyltransferase [Bacteroidota bacterium]